MHIFTHIMGRDIPSYGLLIVIGGLLSNTCAIPIIKKRNLITDSFILIEAYCLLGAFIGAKTLYLAVSFDTIEWNRFFELKYFNDIMRGGFVFYGGMILGLIMIYLAGKIHHIEVGEYARRLIFLIPLMHAFGRVGCFMAGCCYGIPYDGIFAVIFPESGLAPSGIKLFPVQLFEAVFLLMIAITLFFLQFKYDFYYSIELYLASYALLRFVLERYRFDAARGQFLSLSTSQWISIGLILAASCIFVLNKRKLKLSKI